MSEDARGGRPLSPHLSVYKFELNMIMSSLHRIFGVGLALGAALVSWFLLAAATSDEYFALADWALTSWIGLLVLIGCAAAFWFHLFNGLRHLVWDMGYGFERGNEEKLGYAVLGLAGFMTLVTIVLV